MKRKILKILCFALAFATAAGTLPFALADSGDTITYGEYPQTVLDGTDDSELIASLNALVSDDDFVSFGYYSGDGTGEYDENGGLKCAPGDYMKYADVTCGGEKYRAVKFTAYRPEFSWDECPSYPSNVNSQKGFEKDTVYWFRYEPVEWKILSQADGKTTAVSTLVLDAGSYRSTYTESEGGSPLYYYEDSSVKVWLENNFSDAAFEEDKPDIRLMTYTEASDYFASDDERLVCATAYAKINGIRKNLSYQGVADRCEWWLMSTADDVISLVTSGRWVSYHGSVDTANVTAVSGIRPVITISSGSGETGGEEEKNPVKASYLIREYFENADGTYTITETEKEGTAGDTVSYNPAEYNYPDFYVFNESKSSVTDVLSEENTSVLTVYYDREKYKVTFDFACDDYETITATYRYGESIEIPDIPERKGYSVSGWTDAEGNAPEEGEICTGEKAYSLTWTLLDFTITFDTGGTETSSVTAPYGSEITPPDEPVREGYVFAGWSEEIPETMPAYSLEIKALWEPACNVNYTVETYCESSSGTYEKLSSESFTGTTGETVSADISVPSGYVFNSGISTVSDEILPDGSTVLSLYYDRKSYILSFNIEGTVTSCRMKQGDEISYPDDPSKEGYTFVKWDSSPETMPAEDLMISAVFIKNPVLLFRGFTSSKSIGYRTTVTYHADFDGENAKLIWIYKGDEYADDGSCSFTVANPVVSYTIGCRVVSDGGTIDSGTETVRVRSNTFFDKIIWFFQSLFFRSSLVKDQW